MSLLAYPDGLCLTSTVNALSFRADWTPVSGALSYNVYRSSVPHYGWEYVGSVPGPMFYDNPQADGPTLNVWNTYYYRVSAVNGDGEGAMCPPATYLPYHWLSKAEVPVPGLSIWRELIN